MSFDFFLDNDNLIELDGLRDEATGQIVNGATVNADFFDPTGTLIFSVPLDYVTNSLGVYQGTIPSGTATQAGARYQVVITVSAPAIAKWITRVNVHDRVVY